MPSRTLPLPELARVCLAAPDRCGGTRVIGIDGRSGSGKTELAGRLATLLPGPDGSAPAQIVHLDDIYPGWDGLAATPPLVVDWLLEPLAGGRPAGVHRYDWDAGAWARWHPVGPGGVLLLEGVGSGARVCARYLSLLVWLEAPEAVRQPRAIARDGESFAREWDRWARQEERYLADDGTPDRADLRLDASGSAPAAPGSAGDVVLLTTQEVPFSQVRPPGRFPV